MQAARALARNERIRKTNHKMISIYLPITFTCCQTYLLISIPPDVSNNNIYIVWTTSSAICPALRHFHINDMIGYRNWCCTVVYITIFLITLNQLLIETPFQFIISIRSNGLKYIYNFKNILWHKHVVDLWEAHNLLDFVLK